MKFNVETQIPFSQKEVFIVYRDNMEELAAFLPNVREIQLHERKENEDGSILVANLWKAKGEVPAFAKTLIKPEMLEWINMANWYEDKFQSQWQIKPNFLVDVIICKGSNSFIALDENNCHLEVEGEITINPEKIPGPKFMRNKLAGQVEKFIVKLITPNYQKIGDSICDLLSQKA